MGVKKTLHNRGAETERNIREYFIWPTWELESEHIRQNYFDITILLHISAQCWYKSFIDLDRHHASRFLSKNRCDNAAACTNVKHNISFFDGSVPDEFFYQRGAAQEILRIRVQTLHANSILFFVVLEQALTFNLVAIACKVRFDVIVVEQVDELGEIFVVHDDNGTVVIKHEFELHFV